MFRMLANAPALTALAIMKRCRARAACKPVSRKFWCGCLWSWWSERSVGSSFRKGLVVLFRTGVEAFEWGDCVVRGLGFCMLMGF